MFWYYDLVVERLLKIGGLLQEASLSEHFLSKPSCLTASTGNQFIRPRKLLKWRYCPWNDTSISLENPWFKWMKQLSFFWLGGKNLISGKRGDDKTHNSTSQCLEASFTGNAFTKKSHCQSICHQATRNSSILTYESLFEMEERKGQCCIPRNAQHKAK